jgi:tRNA/tmRNA/rRNA uracil-C5-methylase (TrmA/RlmC/RlmD family)
VSVHESIPPGCEPACHGCRHRHLPATASLAQKAGYLGRVLERWSGRLAPVHAPSPERRFGYRDRATLTARWDDTSGWRFGLMRRDELIPIPTCPVHSARINRLVATLRATLPAHAEFPLAYLHVAGAQATLIVKARSFSSSSLGALRVKVPEVGIDGLWVHCHPSAGRKLFARSGWHLAWGAAESATPDGLVHGPAAFQQLLPELHDLAVDIASRHLAPAPGVAVLDLYCGLGATLRHWTDAGAAALGVELAGGAVDAALRNAPRASVLRGTCLQRLPQVRQWWSTHAGPRVAYVNPPRSGLEAELLAALADELRPLRIAYLSCSAGTLARDLAVLESAGYSVRSLEPFDFFPVTHHVECLALLELGDGATSGSAALR